MQSFLKYLFITLTFILIFLGGIFAISKDDVSEHSKPSNLRTLSERHPQGIHLDDIPNGLPITGNEKISSHYGNRIDPFTNRVGFHAGIDFPAKVGTPIFATANGKVKRTGLDSRGNGLFIEVEHDSGYSSLYAHLNRLDFIAGEQISKGQILGGIGSTGKSTGPHLHYEISYRGLQINPVNFLLSRVENSLQSSTYRSELKEILVIRNEGYYVIRVPR